MNKSSKIKFPILWQRYVDLKESISTLPQIIAVSVGIKPCFDDWIETDKWDEYQLLLKDLNLLYKIESAFIKSNLDSAIGKEFLNTTKFAGSFLNSINNRDISYHVIISKENTTLEEGFKNSWYPISINNRITIKPHIDHYWYGLSLGYPECCSKYFFINNEWHTNSIYAQLYSDNTGLNFLCNNFLKNLGFSYIFHIPCSFNCQKTIEYAEKVRGALVSISIEYVDKIDYMLKLPILHFHENCSYLLIDGQKNENSATYSNAIFLGNDQSENKYNAILDSGNSILLCGNKVLVYSSNKFENIIECFNYSRHIQIPLLLKFN